MAYIQRVRLSEAKSYLAGTANSDASLDTFLSGGAAGGGRYLCEHLTRLNGVGAGTPAGAWPTLVLGSECLRIRDLAKDALKYLPSALRAGLSREMPYDPKDPKAVDRVYTFVRQLVEDHLGIAISESSEGTWAVTSEWSTEPTATLDESQTESQPDIVQEDEAQSDAEQLSEKLKDWQIKLIVATAALTECYFDAKSRATQSVSRWSREPVNASGSGIRLERARAALSGLRAAMDDCQPASRPSQRIVETVEAARQLIDKTGDPQVSIRLLQTLTEITWYELVSVSPLWLWYPEWQAFLLELSLMDQSRRLPHGSLRPAVADIEDAGRMVSNRLKKVAIKSANYYQGGSQPESEVKRVEAYLTYAALLRTQANLRAQRRQAQDPAPLRLAAMGSPSADPQVTLGGPCLSGDAHKDAGVAGSVALAPLRAWSDDDSDAYELPPESEGVAVRAARTSSSATLRTSAKGELGTPPPATAFVTTFDLEFEMALCSGESRGPFVMAIPVNLVDDSASNDKGTPMWLGRVVDYQPGTSLFSCLAEPDDKSWFMFGATSGSLDLEPASGFTHDPDGPYGGADPANPHLDLIRSALPERVKALGDLPIVVRITGCPLVELPDIQTDDEFTLLGQAAAMRAGLTGSLKTAGGGTRGGPSWLLPVYREGGRSAAFRLLHATLLDEHNAIRLSLPEVSESLGLGLPAALTNGCSGDYWRYWLLLGVELSDPVIRYRLVSQLLSPGLSSADDGTVPNSALYGMALNQQPLSPRASDLLLWCGLDSVTDSNGPDQLTGQLTHYMRHLASDGAGNAPVRWPSKTSPSCPSRRKSR